MSYEMLEKDYEAARAAFVEARNTLAVGGLVSDETRPRLLETPPEGMQGLAEALWDEGKGKVAVAIEETLVPAAERLERLAGELRDAPEFVAGRRALAERIEERLAREELELAKAQAKFDALKAVSDAFREHMFSPDLEEALRPIVEAEQEVLDGRRPPDEVDIARYRMVKEAVQDIVKPAKLPPPQELTDFVADAFDVDPTHLDLKTGNVILNGGGVITPESVAAALSKTIRNAEFHWQRIAGLQRLDRWSELTGREWSVSVEIPEWMATPHDRLHSVMDIGEGMAMAIVRGAYGWEATLLENTGHATEEFMMAAAIRDEDLREVSRLAASGVEVTDEILTFVGRTAEEVSEEFGIETPCLLAPPTEEPAQIARGPRI